MCYINFKEEGECMNININRTCQGVKTYPLHSHADYEIIYYLDGEGFLKTENGDFSYTSGTIIIVPPLLMHGSTSQNGFINISVNGDLRQLLKFEETVVMHDNEKKEGRLLAELLFENRHSNRDFISSLCQTYVLFLLSNLKISSNIETIINKIISEISVHAFDSNLNITDLLKKSGYAEDYIRNQFKIKTGKTPTAFLTEIRIDHACYLMDIYKDSACLSQIAEQCGFEDYVYFSKRFRQFKGISPRNYKEEICR